MKGEKGFTVVEVIIGLVITGILATAVAAAIPTAMQWLPRQSNKLGVEGDLSFARYWLTRDANAAETFVPLASPGYGYLQWRDFSAESMVTYKVTYSYDAASASLVREERQNDVVQSSLPVARKILSQNDAWFTWSPGTGKLSVALTATIEDAPGVGTYSRSATIVTALRPRLEPAVSPPGEEPALPPPPGSETYYISGEPTIITGSLVSGNGTSLHDVDGNYYVVAAASVSGGKQASWWGESQVMTAPATISQIEVRFTGKSSSKDVLVEFFVKNSDVGFPATAASAFTFTEGNTDTTRSFYLNQATLDYINSLSQRKVTLKVVATATPTFSLSTDQILFIASP